MIFNVKKRYKSFYRRMNGSGGALLLINTVILYRKGISDQKNYGIEYAG